MQAGFTVHLTTGSVLLETKEVLSTTYSIVEESIDNSLKKLDALPVFWKRDNRQAKEAQFLASEIADFKRQRNTLRKITDNNRVLPEDRSNAKEHLELLRLRAQKQRDQLEERWQKALDRFPMGAISIIDEYVLRL